jgi:tetratricopeptide (TPR) repeat protein
MDCSTEVLPLAPAPPRSWRAPLRALVVLALALLAACASSAVVEPAAERPATVSPAPGARAPGNGAPAPTAPTAPGVQPGARPAPRLSAATAALVNQARAQAAHGDADLALTTLDRALRIEPENPLLWLELAQVQVGAMHYALADSMAHKALQLAAGDQAVQARAWRLIADSLRARDLNADARAADARAAALAPR